VSSILFDVSLQSGYKVWQKLTHKPTAEWEEQRIDCSPSNQNTEI
jgi:hypothetical protein